MMQPELVHTFLQRDYDESSTFGLNYMGSYAGESDEHELYSSITTLEDSSMVSSGPYFQKMKLSKLDDGIQGVFLMDNISQQAEEIEAISGTSLEDVLRWWGEIEEMDNLSSDYTMENEVVCDSKVSVINSSDDSMMLQSAVLPLEQDMQVEGQTSLCHLLKAYGEAMEMGQIELANVIMGRINETSSPLGGTMERVAFNLFQSGNEVHDYIIQESMKNFKSAFKAFYEIFPHGRFSHFVANLAIFEAIIMSNPLKVHIIDFDMGEGVQWPALLEAIRKRRKEIKLTSIRINKQSSNFEKTRNHLLDFANACELKLEVQEKTIEDLVLEIEGSHEQEFIAFNCMVGLPHMGRTRNRHEVMDFLSVAKHCLVSNNGIMTFGDGEVLERMNYGDGYSSFFDKCIKHYHALCESMEGTFPEHFIEARIALESLFMAPYVSSISWHQKWENIKRDSRFKENLGLKGCRLSKESLKEAKEVVKEGQSSYKIKVEGSNENEMVLEWRGTPLVRVSAWK